MNYAQAIEYMYAHLPMFQRIGASAYKKDLTNTYALLKILNNPQESLSAIHIAGTNGKGSVSNMIASICAESGYTTGLYTSPHLVDFRERIRVNGMCCDELFVTDFIFKMQPHIEIIQPSFFEITVAMAFEYFKLKGVDIAIIEVGLGGRLDSTNVITPKLSVITNIGYDHMHMLGNTLQEIAFEKAGIIKPQVPVVIGDINPEILPVFEKRVLESSTTLFPAPENVQVTLLNKTYKELELDVSYLNQLVYPSLKTDLTANYQLANIATVIQAVEVMRSLNIELPEEAIYEGLANVKRNTGFAGRWQVLQEHPLIVADCAHNMDGLKALFEEVKSIRYEVLHIVCGTVNDKDLINSLPFYPANAKYYFCKPDIPRGLDAAILAKEAYKVGLKGNIYPNVESALLKAIENGAKNDLILICGSIFVVAEALPSFEN